MSWEDNAPIEEPKYFIMCAGCREMFEHDYGSFNALENYQGTENVNYVVCESCEAINDYQERREGAGYTIEELYKLSQIKKKMLPPKPPKEE